MGNCAICGKENCKAYLFMPSNIFVFLCNEHGRGKINDDINVPVKEWVESTKRRHEELIRLIKFYKN